MSDAPHDAMPHDPHIAYDAYQTLAARYAARVDIAPLRNRREYSLGPNHSNTNLTAEVAERREKQGKKEFFS